MIHLDNVGKEQGKDKAKLLAVMLILALSAALRAHALGVSSYWIDEMVSLHFAKNASPLSVLWDNNPPSYHLLLKGWVSLFGDTEVATRTLSVLFSVGATLVVTLLGFELTGGLAGGVVTGVFHALSFLSIAYAQETRMYAMFEFFAALNLYAFFLLLHHKRGAAWFIASALAMAAVHYLALLPIVVEVLVLGHALWRRYPKIVHSLAFCVFAAIVLEITFYETFFKWEGLQWQTMKFSLEPQSHWPLELASELMDRSVVFAVGAVALIALGALWARKARADAARLLVLIVAPVALMLGFGFVTHRAVFLPRYFVYLAPTYSALLGLSAAGVLEMKRDARLVRFLAVAGALVLVGAAWNVPSLYRPSKEPWRNVAEVVAKYPNALVLTTRTVAIGTPYFERAGIAVEKFSPFTQGGAEKMLDEIGARKRVWIIENFWGGQGYMPELKRRLEKMNYRISELTMRTDYSAPVLVMLVEEKGQ